ncbi:MAG: hypothetical protein WDN49_06115 [Acetobacteraceae bacterium]
MAAAADDTRPQPASLRRGCAAGGGRRGGGPSSRVATRAGLAARRDAIEIVHGLGATDGFIAARFANRATVLAASGACIGALCALPVLLGLAQLAAPFVGTEVVAGPAALLPSLPAPLWFSLPVLPVVAAVIGWLTAQGTVRRWLRQLP